MTTMLAAFPIPATAGFLFGFSRITFTKDVPQLFLSASDAGILVIPVCDGWRGFEQISEVHRTEDIDQWLEHLAPFRKDYKHRETGEDNGDSHLKALLIHHEVIVPITGGKLDLGTWQRIFYAEFDGQRDKRVIVKVMGE